MIEGETTMDWSIEAQEARRAAPEPTCGTEEFGLWHVQRTADEFKAAQLAQDAASPEEGDARTYPPAWSPNLHPGIEVAFEAPKELVDHPDAVIVYGKLGNTHGGYDPVISVLSLKGCDTCGDVLSRCKCATPAPAEWRIYVREKGLNRKRLDSVMGAPRRRSGHPVLVGSSSGIPLGEGDIKELFGGFREYTGTDGRRCITNDFTPIDLDFLDFANRNKDAVHIRFIYPEKFMEAVNTVYEHLGGGQKCDIAPELEGNKWGPSATITMPTPPVGCLKNYLKALEEAQKGKTTIVFDDLRLACQLRFDYGFKWYGRSWEVYKNLKIMRGGN
jgi:hypothetical protein